MREEGGSEGGYRERKAAVTQRGREEERGGILMCPNLKKKNSIITVATCSVRREGGENLPD